MQIEIWHNPRCGTSRKTLAALKAGGYEPVIVEYLKAPPSVEAIERALSLMGEEPDHIFRRRGAPDEAIAAYEGAASPSDKIKVLNAHPILIERPIVVTDAAAVLCRPKETVLKVAPDANFVA